MSELITHTIPPFYQPDSTILILGTMPSPKSRETGFYYGHPQNRFWKILPALYKEPPLSSIGEKKAFLTRHKIALWDVLASCEITGADDSSIKNPVPNDIGALLAETKITKIFTTGKKAYALYEKYSRPVTGAEAVSLPSTSPANCRMSLEQLTEDYKIILER